MIALSDIHFSYGKYDVLKGISLGAKNGEIVGILGPNGAGKSTLINIMAGILKARTGRVYLDGRPIGDLPRRAVARRIALVPQTTSVPFSFSALEVVLMGRTPHISMLGFESARDIAIAQNAMAETDCLAFADRNINALSGGERQRVFLARALAQEPRLLLLDEPTTFLDIGHQAELLRLLKKQNRERGTAIIAAMHDLNLAGAFCDRIILIRAGAVCADGIPPKVITEGNIAKVFGATAKIAINEHSGKPYAVLTDF